MPWRDVHPRFVPDNYDLNVTTPESNIPKLLCPGDITSALCNGPWLHVQPLLPGLWHEVQLSVKQFLYEMSQVPDTRFLQVEGLKKHQFR